MVEAAAVSYLRLNLLFFHSANLASWRRKQPRSLRHRGAAQWRPQWPLFAQSETHIVSTLMTDDDFMFIHHAGRLKEFCTALTLDLQPMTNDEEFQA